MSGIPKKSEVTYGRLEIERDGKTAYMEYALGEGVLELIHTEVPKELRGKGLSTELAHAALEWAREQNLKVDVVCPSVANYLHDHPEYSDLILK